MAHYDLHEQEQLAKIKYFWRDYGKYVIGLIVILVLGYLVSGLYAIHQSNNAKNAAVVYADFTISFNQNDQNKIFALSNKLINEFPNTEYAPMSALLAAKIAFEHKDYAKAQQLLNFAKANLADKSLQSIAILRLASLYIDEKKFPEARSLLLSAHDLAFDGLFYEARGDMYIAMNDLTKARFAYKEGLEKAANDPSISQVLQMKLDIIGG